MAECFSIHRPGTVASVSRQIRHDAFMLPELEPDSGGDEIASLECISVFQISTLWPSRVYTRQWQRQGIRWGSVSMGVCIARIHALPAAEGRQPCFLLSHEHRIERLILHPTHQRTMDLQTCPSVINSPSSEVGNGRLGLPIFRMQRVKHPLHAYRSCQ